MTTEPEPRSARRRPRPPVIDPTANVLQLVNAAMKRQDDLRRASDRQQKALDKQERRHRRETRELEAKYRDAQQSAESRRLDALLSDLFV